jgi:hypothetical protein
MKSCPIKVKIVKSKRRMKSKGVLEVVSMEHEFEVTSDIFERWTPVGIEYTSNCNLICVQEGKGSVECHIIH